MTVYNKHKSHLRDLKLKNQKKKEEEIEKQVRLNENLLNKVKITEQVLANMKTKRIKESKQSVKAKPAMTPF